MLMRLIKQILIVLASIFVVGVIALLLFLEFYVPPLSNNFGKVEAQLFVGDSKDQPLIVAFGGSQGGNPWAEDYWSGMRQKFLHEGYAVLSIGYFGTKHGPEALDRISLNAIYDTIIEISKHPNIDETKIALLGSSRGGELALNLASRYTDFDAVVAIVPSHVSFAGLTLTANTSAWIYNGTQIPYVGIPFKGLIPAIRGQSKKAVQLALEDEASVSRSVIPVELTNGPILLLSAKDDQLWPSKYMSDQIVARLREHHFKHYYEHYSFDGGHHDTKRHFEKVFVFLNDHFK
jgi:dienelactone hydrolase